VSYSNIDRTARAVNPVSTPGEHRAFWLGRFAEACITEAVLKAQLKDAQRRKVEASIAIDNLTAKRQS